MNLKLYTEQTDLKYTILYHKAIPRLRSASPITYLDQSCFNTEEMMEIEFRTLTMADYDDMVKLWRQAELPFKPKGRDSRDAVQRQMHVNPEFFLGAFHEEMLVGVIVGGYDDRKKGWINRLAVHPLYQRRGVAQELVTRMEDALGKQGAQIFCALIEKVNQPSVKLFEKLGYVASRSIMYFSKRESQDV